MGKELIEVNEAILLPDIFERAKNLPTRTISERYGSTTKVKIFGWALCCMYSYILNQQGYTFKQIQEIILENTQSPFYIDPVTLWREAWIWKNIIVKKPQFLDDSHLSKSWYKRMSQHKVPEPIKELEYVATRKQEESIKHKKYSISMWEQERGYVKKPEPLKCAYCEEEMEHYHKICTDCFKAGI